MPASAQTILFLAANPTDMDRLQLGTEVRDIEEGLRRAQHRDAFNFEQRWAVRPRDVRRAMLDVNPQIVHFSGYGKADTGLVLEDAMGQAKPVEGAALASLFELFAQQVRCVVLNGCYSEGQAAAIAQHIPFVIGMKGNVESETQIEFSVGFYDALSAGRDIDFAYQLGCNAIQMAGLNEHLMPLLIKQPLQQSKTPGTNAPTQSNNSQKTSMPPRSSAPEPNIKSEPLNVFISYSRKDEQIKDELYVHLSGLRRKSKINEWQDREIEAGKEWSEEIKAQMEAADIFLLLVTPRFIASDYCYEKEIGIAMKRHKEKSARVIPIIMKPCDWKDTPLGDLQALPRDAKPITTWDNQDEALLDTVRGIGKVVNSLTKNSAKK